MTDIDSNDTLCTRPAPATLSTAKHGGCVQLGYGFSEWWSSLPQDIGQLTPYELAKFAYSSALAARPAQAVDLDEARREGHDCAVRYVLGYLNGTGDLASTQYGEILNGCGRESIIRSAIRDGELEFTGLGRWVAKYGTDAERALIDSQAVHS